MTDHVNVLHWPLHVKILQAAMTLWPFCTMNRKKSKFRSEENSMSSENTARSVNV